MYLYYSICCFTFAVLFFLFSSLLLCATYIFHWVHPWIGWTVGQTDDRAGQHCELSNRYMKRKEEGVRVVTEKVPFGSRALSWTSISNCHSNSVALALFLSPFPFRFHCVGVSIYCEILKLYKEYLNKTKSIATPTATATAMATTIAATKWAMRQLYLHFMQLYSIANPPAPFPVPVPFWFWIPVPVSWQVPVRLSPWQLSISQSFSLSVALYKKKKKKKEGKWAKTDASELRDTFICVCVRICCVVQRESCARFNCVEPFN